MSEMMRLNTRITTEINDWLEESSKERGISKSTLILLALEQYMQQQNTYNAMKDMETIMNKLEQLVGNSKTEN